MKPRFIVLIAAAVWGASFWLASNGGLYLVVDANGDKYCVDGLSRYFGFPQTVPALAILGTVSVLLVLSIPVVLAAWAAVHVWLRRGKMAGGL